MFVPEDVDDLEDFLTPSQLKQLKDKLRNEGKVLVRGVPLIPEVSEARTQGDWSCPKMRKQKFARKRVKKYRRR